MSHQLHIDRVRKVNLPTVEARHESDPDIRRRFEMCLTGDKKTDDKSKAPLISEITKSLLSHEGGVSRLGNAEVIRQGDMLSYRLLNGPMMGLVIQASYQSQGIQLLIYPKNERQSQVMARLIPKLSQELMGRRCHIVLELMPAKDLK